MGEPIKPAADTREYPRSQDNGGALRADLR